MIESVNFGFRQLEQSLFDVLKEFDESSFNIFPRLVNVFMDFSPQMRFLYQAVSSPDYESHREEQFRKVNDFYDKLGNALADYFDCPYEIIKDYISEIMTLMSYHTLWGSRDMAAIQFNRIFSDFKNAVLSYRRISSTTG
jgi:hypothetical protein